MQKLKKFNGRKKKLKSKPSKNKVKIQLLLKTKKKNFIIINFMIHSTLQNLEKRDPDNKNKNILKK